ncbi:MAG: 3'(2'),5'-bisphosphate nucleotidase CysQ family protein [Candidatus Marinamargulisbacteria bacterium]
MIDILSPIIDDVIKVGELAYEKYRSDVKITIKDDQTPVTNVDQMIHEELLKSLNQYFPDIPVISEEGEIPSVQERQAMVDYWALDPLDGTVDFIKETDQFVISLGYISKGNPTMGIIHHPVSGTTWMAVSKCGVFIQQHGGQLVPLAALPKIERDDHVILVSAHRNDHDLTNIIARQREKELNRSVRIVPLGSALKFGYLVEGRADEYVRFTNTKEWDVAAGHCLVNEAGFEMVALDLTSPIEYQTEDMIIPPFTIRR